MVELPTGTVTFLFTDIEGSTRLVKQLRDAYGEVLAAHQTLLRDAFERHGGHEIDTQGDAFFVAFRRARDAVAAAVDGQRALAAHPWPDGVDLRVRMGIHTAEPAVGGDRYTGMGVHRAARIMAAGHGGQIVVSQATCSVLDDDELPGVRLRDLGEHQLKDIDRPDRIFQVEVDDLPQDFPPLRAEEAPTAYTGREEELVEAARAAVWQMGFWRRRRVGAAAAVLVAVAVAAAVALILVRSDTEVLSHVGANALGLIDSGSGKIVGQVDVGATPAGIARGEGAVWVANTDLDRVSRIDPAKNLVVDTIPVGSSPSRLTVAAGAVWTANSLDGTVSRIDPETNTVVQTIPVGTFPVGIIHAAGSIWVANTGDSTLTRIDADSGVPETLPVAATELAVGDGTLWASDRTGNRVTRIDPASGAVLQPISVGNGPQGLAYGERAAWVANALDGTVSKIDPATNAVVATIPIGAGATAVAAGAGSVWVTNHVDGTVARIDPNPPHDVERIRVGNRPQAVAIAGDDVLVTVRESGAAHRGGTLRVRTDRDLHSIDTAVAYDTSAWMVLRMTNDGLVGFNQAGGLQGTQLVPDLAVSLPTPTDGGRRYTFRLRPNIRYSTGKTLKASDVRATFERLYEVGELPVTYYDGLLGAARCRQAPRRCDLSRGVVVNDAARTVSFHLSEPDPEFLYKLALPFAYVLPAAVPATKAGAGNPLPATGPYTIAQYRLERVLRLRRNPHFREWSQPAQPGGYPDEIAFEIGGTPDDSVRDVIRGKADIFSSSQSQNVPSKEQLAAVKTRHASQVRTNPQPSTIGLFLNTRVAPFDRADVRRAITYAANRSAAVRVAGGPDVAQATCQILPPSFPGYRPYCPFTAGDTTRGRWTRPNLAKARALVAASGTRGMKITVWSWADKPWPGVFAVRLLRSLGYRASMKSGAGFAYFERAFDSRTKAQIGTWEWISDYPASSGFYSPILTCKSFLPNNPANSNAAEFCDLRIDHEVVRATVEQLTNPAAARERWGWIDRQTVDQAPLVPLVNPKAVDVLSKRVGNYQFSPQLGVLLDQLWVR